MDGSFDEGKAACMDNKREDGRKGGRTIAERKTVIGNISKSRKYKETQSRNPIKVQCTNFSISNKW